MLYKLTLKNCEKTVVVDDRTYEYIQNNAYLQQIEFLKHLRIHSNGYAFFQKNWPLKNGKYRNETIYLHKMIGEQLLERPESNIKLYVHFKNGNKLDCRRENLGMGLNFARLCAILPKQKISWVCEEFTKRHRSTGPSYTTTSNA